MAERIKTVCPIEGYENVWLEWDVSEWDMGVFVEVHSDMTVSQVITEFIPKYTVDWYMVSDNGATVAHPGPNASAETWLNVWRQIGVATSRALFLWMWVSVLSALQESMALPPKSEADDSGNGAGPSDAADGGAGDSAD